MVRTDTVYQRVLALANKEQRGYITPQEFNLFACQAQLQIIDQYFYDINQFGRLHGNDTEYSDMLNLLDEKISVLTTTATAPSSPFTLPDNLYRLGSVFIDNTEAEPVNINEFRAMDSSPLTRPNAALDTKVYTLSGGQVALTPPNGTITYTYIVEPECPYWGYAVINGEAMYDPDHTINFVLHSSEESELVHRILIMAGITIKQPDLVQIGTQIEAAKQQREKS